MKISEEPDKVDGVKEAIRAFVIAKMKINNELKFKQIEGKKGI